jgi:predicted FMN-binding regulatory protein PaiB
MNRFTAMWAPTVIKGNLNAQRSISRLVRTYAGTMSREFRRGENRLPHLLNTAGWRSWRKCHHMATVTFKEAHLLTIWQCQAMLIIISGHFYLSAEWYSNIQNRICALRFS